MSKFTLQDVSLKTTIAIFLLLIAGIFFNYYILWVFPNYLYEILTQKAADIDSDIDPNIFAINIFFLMFLTGVVAIIIKSIFKMNDGFFLSLGFFSIVIGLIGLHISDVYSFIEIYLLYNFPLLFNEENYNLGLALIYILIFLVVYVIPSIVAYVRNHNSKLSILFTNILLGWTIVGWVISIIWAGTGNVKINKT